MVTSQVLEHQLDHQLEEHSRASVEKWKVIKYALDSWQRTIRLCLILLVAMGSVAGLLHEVLSALARHIP